MTVDHDAIEMDDNGLLPWEEGYAGTESVPKYGRLRKKALAEVKSRSVRHLVDGLIPLKTYTQVAGIGGLGKSTLLAQVAADESAGRLLGGKPHNVIVISSEDTAEEIWRPRILAAEGDVDRVHWVTVSLDDGGIVVLPEDLSNLEQMVRDLGSRLVVIDPIIASIDLALDGHKDQHVRSVLGKLRAMAEDTGCAVAGVGHLNRTPSKDAFIRIANSMAFWNAARSVVLVTEDEQNDDEDDLRLVAQVKVNWTKLKTVQRHRIEEVVLPDEIDQETQEPVVTSRMVFIENLPGFDVSEVLDQKKTSTDEKLMEAVVFLAHALSDGDWHDSAGLVSLAVAQGIKERTLKRAALEELDVEHERRGFQGTTWWRLSSGAKLVSESVGTTDASQSEVSSHANPYSQNVGTTGETAQPSPSTTPPAPVMPTASEVGELARLEAPSEQVAATNGKPTVTFCPECKSHFCRHVAPEIWGES